MAIEKVIDIKVQGNADEVVGSLRSQLRAAQADVAALSDQFGATSREASEAAKRAGILKDKIGDAKALTDAFNPDAKFKSLSSSLSGVASGFAVVQGGMGLFGAESKDVEKTLLKVQSAMALSAGLQQIGEARDSFKQLGTVAKSYSVVQKVITAAQWLWNAAMAANPIGAIVVAITALIAGGYALVKMFKDSSAANEVAMKTTIAHTKELEAQSKAAKKSSDNLKDHNGHLFDMAKAAGASAEELRKLSIQHADEEVALAKNNATIAANTFNRERNTLATLKAAGASDEVIAAQQKLTNESYKEFKEQDKILVESYKNRKEVVQKNEVEILQEKTNATKKANDDAKTKREQDAKDLAEAQKKKLEAIKQHHQDLLKEADDFFRTAAENEKKLKEENDKLVLDQRAILEAGIKEMYVGSEDEETENKFVNTQARIKLTKEEKKARIDALDAVSNTLEMASELAGKQTGIGKTLAIVSATISMFTSAQKAYESTVGIPFVGPTLAPINAGLAIAVGLKNIANINKVKVPGGSGGGGGSTPSVSASGGSAPQFNVVGNSGVNQLASVMTTNQQQPPIKTYVVASDVTSGQSLDRNIIKNASLG